MPYHIHPWKAKDLLVLSQRYGGHPCTKHLYITNDEMMNRMYRGEGRSRLNKYSCFISAFITLDDAGEALSQLFAKLPKGAVQKVTREGGPMTSDWKDYTVDRCFRVRIVTGAGVKTFETNRVTLAIRRKVGFDPHGFIVDTFYPVPPFADKIITSYS